MHLKTITFIAFLLFMECNAKSYRDHLLIHGTPKSDIELEFFKGLGLFYNATFWRKPSIINKPVQFSLSRLSFAELNRDTEHKDIEFLVMIRDLQSAFDSQTIKPYVRRRMESFDWRNYYRVEDIYNWLRDLEELHPHNVQIQNIGQSVQKRHILAVKIEFKSKLENRSTVVVEGGCHAREWISPAFVTYMINTILNAKNSSNKELKMIAHKYIWKFIPLLNPDGYSYSQTTDRLWRKNYHGTYGVDLNRNFGVAFGKFGADKHNEKHEEYCGVEPFSEPESLALANFVSDNGKNVDYYLSIHSYGQFLIIPYAYSKDHLSNFDAVKSFADQLAKRSSNKHGIHYQVGTAFDTVGYFASGTSSDWVKSSIKVPFVLTIELPDQGFYGFALPKEKILPTCEATMDSVLSFLAPNKGAVLRYDSHDDTNGVKQHKMLWFLVTHSCVFVVMDI